MSALHTIFQPALWLLWFALLHPGSIICKMSNLAQCLLSSLVNPVLVEITFQRCRQWTRSHSCKRTHHACVCP
jgi:hypothetical protein